MARPRERSKGAAPPHRECLHDKNGTRRKSTEVSSAGLSGVEGAGENGANRGPKGRGCCSPERSHLPVRRRGSNFGVLFGLAHPGVDEGAVINRYNCLQSEQSAERSKIMLTGRINGGRKLDPPRPHCPHRHQEGCISLTINKVAIVVTVPTTATVVGANLATATPRTEVTSTTDSS